MRPDPNTPAWIQHIAFQVKDMDALREAKRRAEAEGQAVIGPVDHTLFRSIYFHDPSGNRLEVAAWTGDPADMAKLGDTAEAMLEEWQRTKRPPRSAAWIHEREFGVSS